MKRVKNLYDTLISDDNLKLALLEVNITHRWYSHHKPNKTVRWVEQDVPARIEELRAIINGLINSEIELTTPKKKHRWDKSAGKWRDINEPLLWPDQYVHHALIQVLQPVMMRGMDRYCCGSIRNRGIHYGLKAIKKWMKDDKRGTKYCLEADIHHFYDSVDPKFVIARMKQLVKDHKVISLVESVLKDGVLIGIYCSQWFANTILQPLDHMIREKGYGVTHYLRYMDNFTIFSSNKRKLKKLLLGIQKWLASIGLKLKSNWQIFATADRLPTALGYRYGHGYTLLKKRNLLRLKRKLSCYYRKKRKGKKISMKMATGLLSRLGQLQHCNRKNILKKIYRGKVQRELKEVVRYYSRKERLRWSTFLEETISQEGKFYKPKEQNTATLVVS